MSEQDKNRWEKRYVTGSYGGRTHPSEILVSWAPRVLASRGDAGTSPRALDLACGTGRNAHYLAGLGFAVDALDIAEAGLDRARTLVPGNGTERGLQEPVHSVRWLQQDLDQGLPAVFSGYDLILLVRYVNLALLGNLSTCLKPGGWLICEEHLQSRHEVIGPSDPRFRVAPGALTEAAAELEILLAEDGLHRDPDGRPVALARLVARRRVETGV